jgi:heterodisulfide reductase subunit C
MGRALLVVKFYRLYIRRPKTKSLARDGMLAEHSLRYVFPRDVYAILGSEKINECIQRGTCSASCPTSYGAASITAMGGGLT